MNQNLLQTDKDGVAKITRRGIAALVTYSNKRSSSVSFSEKPKYVWPSSLKDDSRYISRRVYNQGG